MVIRRGKFLFFTRKGKFGSKQRRIPLFTKEASGLQNLYKGVSKKGYHLEKETPKKHL